MIFQKEYVSPLTFWLNEDFDINVSEEYIISKINKGHKHVMKSKRSVKHTNNMLFKTRSYPNTLELVKIADHNSLYLLDSSLVVYLHTPASKQDYGQEERRAGCEFEEMAAEHNFATGDGFEEKGLDNASNQDGCDPSRAEYDRGYSFESKVLTVGSFVDNCIACITPKDVDKCKELGINMDMSSKLVRAHANMLTLNRNAEISSDGSSKGACSESTANGDATATRSTEKGCAHLTIRSGSAT